MMNHRVNGVQQQRSTRAAFRDVTNNTRSKNVDGKHQLDLKGGKGSYVLKPSSNSFYHDNNNNVENQRSNTHPSKRANIEPVVKQEVVSTTEITNGVMQARLNMPPPAQASAKESYSLNSYQFTGQVDDIDVRDANDPLCATDYVQEMYEHFRQKEILVKTPEDYMLQQREINEKMRAILVDWLVEVHMKFKLVPETLYLTVMIIDKYLSRQQVKRDRLQLVGVTALLIASKYEEIYPPELRDLVYICDRAYQKEEILLMEERMLKVLDYQITWPSSHAFLVRFLKAAHADKKMVHVAIYILDTTLTSYELLKYLPSQLAAAAVLLARQCVGRNSWSPTLLKYAQYYEEDIRPVAQDIIRARDTASRDIQAVRKKYASSRYGGISNVHITYGDY